MKTIHKYTLKAEPGVQSLKVRKDAKLLKVAQQGFQIALWYEVDTHNDWQELNFIAHLTGEELDTNLHHRSTFIETILLEEGSFVVHLYQINPA